jgi:hypothetical protein
MADVGGVRVPFTAYVGNITWAALNVDLVGTELRMTAS